MRQPPELRERTEELERASLSTWATLAVETKGRDRFEDPDRLRTAFQLDRDRIVGAGHFQRLAARSHLLTAGSPPGFSSRLSYSVQVARIAQVIARVLRLNEDLTEAIALGHSLGSPPLGIAGAEGLRLATSEDFDEAEQSLRIVERLAHDGAGLNLTWETRDGVLNHSWLGSEPATVEGQAVRVAARIATVEQLLATAVAVGGLSGPGLAAEDPWGADGQGWVDATIGDVVATSLDRPEVRMSAAAAEHLDALEGRATETLLGDPGVRSQHNRAVHCVMSLVVFYRENPEELPHVAGVATRPDAGAVDLLSGETDRGLVARFKAHFVPDVPHR